MHWQLLLGFIVLVIFVDVVILNSHVLIVSVIILNLYTYLLKLY